MTSAPYDLDQVVVINYFANTVRWMTPAEARRLCEALDPMVEVIEEAHPCWEHYAKLAGPRPRRIIA